MGGLQLGPPGRPGGGGLQLGPPMRARGQEVGGCSLGPSGGPGARRWAGCSLGPPGGQEVGAAAWAPGGGCGLERAQAPAASVSWKPKGRRNADPADPACSHAQPTGSVHSSSGRLGGGSGGFCERASHPHLEADESGGAQGGAAPLIKGKETRTVRVGGLGRGEDGLETTVRWFLVEQRGRARRECLEH